VAGDKKQMNKWGVFSRDIWLDCIIPKVGLIDELTNLLACNSAFQSLPLKLWRVVFGMSRARTDEWNQFKKAHDRKIRWISGSSHRRLYWVKPRLEISRDRRVKFRVNDESFFSHLEMTPEVAFNIALTSWFTKTNINVYYSTFRHNKST
jgi:hypothetical protein